MITAVILRMWAVADTNWYLPSLKLENVFMTEAFSLHH